MEKIIRKILNYDAQSATKEQSKEMCAAVSALSMFLLDRTGKFDLPEKINIKYSDDVRGGVSSEGEVRLHSNVFRNPEGFLNDISIVVHELTHIAQRHFKDKSKIIRNEESLVCMSNHYNALEYFIAIYEFPELIDIIQYYGVMAASDFSNELNDLHYYFKSFYDLQSFEIEANDFSIEVINYIIKLAHTLKLSPAEKKNLKSLEEESKADKNFYAARDYMKSLRQDETYAGEVKRYIEDLRQYFDESEPELMTAIKSEKGVDISGNEWYKNVIMVLCLSLEIDYDEGLARSLYNSMLNSKKSSVRDLSLLELALWTKLNLKDKELKELESAYNRSSKMAEKATLSKVLSDKKRVQSERDAIDGNLKLDILEFNFE